MWSNTVRETPHVGRTISSIDFPGPSIALVHGSGDYGPSMGIHAEVFVLVREDSGWKIRIHQTVN
jgi:hypothetical protein